MTIFEAVRLLIDVSSRFVSPLLVAAEWIVLALLALAIALVPKGSEGRLGRIKEAFCGLAERRGLTIVICGLLPIIVRLSLLPLGPIPVPSIHDEFGHLLL